MHLTCDQEQVLSEALRRGPQATRRDPQPVPFSAAEWFPDSRERHQVRALLAVCQLEELGLLVGFRRGGHVTHVQLTAAGHWEARRRDADRKPRVAAALNDEE